MAEVEVKVAVTNLDKLWIQKSLELQKSSIIRARNKEFAGSEIWVLRGREIEQIDSILAKVR